MGQVHGGRLVAQALKRHGVDVVFTLCGGHIQAIYDGCIDEEIAIYDTRHEQTAAFAADAHARVTGKPGVVLVTAGPGVTNTVTAMANAQRAGVPMICIGGAGPLSCGTFWARTGTARTAAPASRLTTTDRSITRPRFLRRIS